MATLAAVNTVTTFDVDSIYPDGFSMVVCSGITTTLNTDISAVFTLPYLSLTSKARVLVQCTAFTGTSVTLSYCESPDGVNFLAASTLVSPAVNATGFFAGSVVSTSGLLSQGHFTFTGTFTTATLTATIVGFER